MIKFGLDHDVDQVDLSGDNKVAGLVHLLHYLAGRGTEYFTDSRVRIAEQVDLIQGVVPRTVQIENLSYERLNELLVLVDESRISRAFFEFFFLPETPNSPITLDKFKAGITRFRGFALLAFGNFRFPFRELREITELRSLSDGLMPWTKDTQDLLRGFGEARRKPISDGKETHLAEDETCLLGYIVRAAFEEDKKHLAGATILQEEAKRLNAKIEGAENKARTNSSAYLASDYMDVYFATSMRQVWEFKDTYGFIQEVLSDEDLSGLGLRYFDPTQSHMTGVVEKGLLEALMLKRARCTVYLAQESDTLGKDSELAATLAQGKPVIAYVRALAGQRLVDYCTALRKQSVSYFARRLYALFAEDFFRRQATRDAAVKKLAELGVSDIPADRIEGKAAELLETAEKVRERQVYGILGGAEEEDGLRAELFKRVPGAAQLMAAFDAAAFDRRAKTIAEQHPLAMQVHLETGVANGLLVVRDPKSCAKLLRGMLINELEFSIEPKLERIAGQDLRLGTVLKERISGSNFRYVTAHTLLSNAFWNYYLRDEERFSARRTEQKEVAREERNEAAQ